MQSDKWVSNLIHLRYCTYVCLSWILLTKFLGKKYIIAEPVQANTALWRQPSALDSVSNLLLTWMPKMSGAKSSTYSAFKYSVPKSSQSTLVLRREAHWCWSWWWRCVIITFFVSDTLLIKFATTLGVNSNRHSATLSKDGPGVLHGIRTYVLRSKAIQFIETLSLSAGLDYSDVVPEPAWLKDSGQADYIVATDKEAFELFLSVSIWKGRQRCWADLRIVTW